MKTIAELDALTLEELNFEQERLLAGKQEFAELSEEELQYYIAICAQMSHRARVASKPGANGTGGVSSRRTRKGVKAPETSLTDLLGGLKQ